MSKAVLQNVKGIRSSQRSRCKTYILKLRTTSVSKASTFVVRAVTAKKAFRGNYVSKYIIILIHI